MKENRKMLGNALLILTAMIWGTAFVFQRVGMESIEPITFNASRMALAAVAVGAVSALPSQARKRKLDAMSAAEREAYRRNTIIGGICCGSCHSRRDQIPLTPSQVRWMRQALTSGSAGWVNTPDASAPFSVLRNYVEHRLGRRIRSTAMLPKE